jgi:hypothetical protein
MNLLNLLLEGYKVNPLAQILAIIGLIILFWGIFLSYKVKKEKKKYSFEFLMKVLNFSLIFPGEKVFIWPVLFDKKIFEKAKSLGFYIDFYFDKFIGKFSNKIFNKLERTKILKNSQFESLKNLKEYNCFIFLKKPKNLEFLKEILKDKKNRVITFGFEIDGLNYKSKEDDLFRY